ncbi:dolichol-phosphate mannosyltransferase [Desulfobaculum xiamenense]|uniref:Dolichol-phosphate mannosyltransferase n=1 Tax=Desulfobaculum xiamenense TaxID=995050 RepID=A0A846QX68_9BACT|nr:glycosyltransferase family 2 protein [Desulfobaculum xiamenense]NJB69219.1 dolichol-phosphate mannosyltransferase [Desulfobaculum xiamenense]
MRLSAVIPAYNEAANIPVTVPAVLGMLDAAAEGCSVEVVVVDDHSTDGTFGAVAALGDARVRCLRLSRRSGSHTALRAGLAHARGDAVFCIAADGQDDPAAMAEMVAKWRAGAQVVWALRERRDEGLARVLTARAFYLLLRLLTGGNGGIDLSRADFYLLDRAVVDAVRTCRERNTSLFGLLAWIGFAQDSVDYVRRPRVSGRSKWSLRTRWLLAKDWLIAFSGLPLKAATWLGLASSLAGFCHALWVVWLALGQGVRVEGWASLMVAVLVLGGAQLFMLGVFGEYLWRNLDEARGRPNWFIERDSAGEGGDVC